MIKFKQSTLILATLFCVNQAMAADTANAFANLHMPSTTPVAAVNNTYKTRLIVEFAPDAADQQVLKNSKKGGDRQGKLKKIHAKYMQRMSGDEVTVMRKVIGSDFDDAGPFALGGRVITLNRHLDPDAVAKIIARLEKVPGISTVTEDKLVMPASVDLTHVNPYQYSMYDEVISPVYGFMTYGSGFYNSKTNTFVSYRGKGVTVAVLDTGYIPHPNFMSQLLPQDDQNHYGYDFISDCEIIRECEAGKGGENSRPPRPDALETSGNGVWHGTGVMGIIAGQNNPVNSTIAPYGGVLGGAPEANLVPVRVLGINGSWNSDIINGMLWAAGLHPTIPNPHPAQVINMSMATPGQCPKVYYEAMAQLTEAKVAVVIAGGNNRNVRVENTLPANCPGAISVEALGGFNSPAEYTSNGPATIAAPGGGGDYFFRNATPVIVPYFGPVNGITKKYDACKGDNCFTYTGSAGTSQATPLVAAAIADMLSANRSLTPAQIIEILKKSADPIVNKCDVNGGNASCIEAGKLNVSKAIEMAQEAKYQN